MNDSGFITIHRSIFRWAEPLSDPDFRMALTCIAMANWKDGSWPTTEGDVTIPRGSFVTTIEKLGIELGVGSTRSKIRSGLKRLVSYGFLEISPKIGRRFTYITVCNYSRYQNITDSGDHHLAMTSPSLDPQLALTSPSLSHDLTTIEQGNKGTRETKKQEKGLAAELAAKATEVLNSLSGRSFSPASISITADCKKLAKAGHTTDDVEAVIRAKYREWGTDQHMSAHLKPSVLLRPSNFSKYLAEDVQAGSAQTTYVPGGGDLIQLGVKR